MGIEKRDTFAGIFDALRSRYLHLSRDEPKEVRSLAESVEILPILIDMSGFFALERDGTIEAYSFDDLANPRVEEDQRICNTVWFRGSKLYSELAPFVPQRGENSRQCSYCNGSGIVPNIPPKLLDKVICYCGGLGWIPSAED